MVESGATFALRFRRGRQSRSGDKWAAPAVQGPQYHPHLLNTSGPDGRAPDGLFLKALSDQLSYQIQ
ncbi:hypothetical protein VT03_16850 [Planctomyces sp. SH-PL14]|nr:hypothetical protein VT03_16850 [Planctomyces sp. SH-PL14]